jgi:hypothetical protein
MFQVKSRSTGQVHAYGTSLEGARRKVKQLEAGMNFK